MQQHLLAPELPEPGRFAVGQRREDNIGNRLSGLKLERPFDGQ